MIRFNDIWSVPSRVPKGHLKTPAVLGAMDTISSLVDSAISALVHSGQAADMFWRFKGAAYAFGALIELARVLYLV